MNPFGEVERFKLKIINSLVLNSKWHHAEQQKETWFAVPLSGIKWAPTVWLMCIEKCCTSSRMMLYISLHCGLQLSVDGQSGCLIATQVKDTTEDWLCVLSLSQALINNWKEWSIPGATPALAKVRPVSILLNLTLVGFSKGQRVQRAAEILVWDVLIKLYLHEEDFKVLGDLLDLELAH